MKRLLPLFPRPSHYIGTEEGAVHKNLKDILLHCVLAFPDLYEVGMSYLGQKILYGIINSHEEFYAERVFAPCHITGSILKQYQEPLSTLESDTPLVKTHVVAFSITHELCFTNVLYMLELSGIPLYSTSRGNSLLQWPLIIAGGGCVVSAEPLAPFIDIMLLGEGEELIIEFCNLLLQGRKEHWSRSYFFEKAIRIPGIYVPSLFEPKTFVPLLPDIPTPGRRIVADLNKAPYPEKQVVPFGTIHNRLSVEIARGCTRGCRFCQAGTIYRPARERTISNIKKILESSLNHTGFGDISFLSLSTGDFSALTSLFLTTIDRCMEEQISISLPSLRIGSIDDEILSRLAMLRHTGITLAPEAGSQRMRNIINKGITEEAILSHVRKFFEYGWQNIKLYFMIGLPKETFEDLDAIITLCKKIQNIFPKGFPKFKITASISIFVPKPHTPFQWEQQLPIKETYKRIQYLRNQCKTEKYITLKYHNPKMSYLEGILARGDRNLSQLIEYAYKKGAIFTSWNDKFSLTPWVEAMQELGISPEQYLAKRDVSVSLPWEHLNVGISRDFLLQERKRAFEETITNDCRYTACHSCGSCDRPNKPSLLARSLTSSEEKHTNKLNFSSRDQQEYSSISQNAPNIVPTRTTHRSMPLIKHTLAVKAIRYRIWHTKENKASYISQLELQTLLEKALRKSSIPISFSQGFHPIPLISFGRALPLGVESQSEWFTVILRKYLNTTTIINRFSSHMPQHMNLTYIERIPINEKVINPKQELFSLQFIGNNKQRILFIDNWMEFSHKESFIFTRETKKAIKTDDIRPLFQQINFEEKNTFYLTMNWKDTYISPLKLVTIVTPWIPINAIRLIKLSQNIS